MSGAAPSRAPTPASPPAQSPAPSIVHPPRAGGRLEAIDRMRGVAILLVVVYHAGPLAWRVPPYRADGWLALPSLRAAWLAVPVLHFGFTGVHAFFVVSGFCIHLRAARARHAAAGAPPSMRDFFLRRFWRIYPPYWIALALFGLALPLARGVAIRWSDLGLHAAMLHTFSTRTILSIDPSFWSLATEEQFYLAYPLLAIALARFGARRVLAAALALSLAWRAAVLVAMPPTVAHFMAYRVLLHSFFVPRWFEWILGCWLAEAVAAPSSSLDGRGPVLAAAGALLLALGMACRVHVIVDKLLADAFFSTGYAAITGALLAARGAGSASADFERGSPARANPAARLVSAVGRRAYGTYLVHQPILDGAALRALALPLRLALAAVASWFFSWACERPFEKKSQRAGRPVATTATSHVAVAVAAPVDVNGQVDVNGRADVSGRLNA